jgi:hypothetical protein
MSTEDEIKLPGSSFDEIGKIVQAYSSANRPMSLGDVSKRTGIHPTVVSRNNGFLLSVGIVEGGKSKAITPLGRRLGHALSHNLDSETAVILREVVEASGFLRNVVGAVRIRRGMDDGALKSHIAYSAGQSKSQSVMTGTGAILELLRRAKLIEEHEGKYIASPQAHVPATVSGPTEASSSGASAGSALVVGSQTAREQGDEPPYRFNRKVDASGFTLNINVEISVACHVDELSSVGAKLRELVKEFERSPENDAE